MATDPVALASAVAELQSRQRLAREHEERQDGDSGGLVNGLIKDFGLGTEPVLRRRLYDRLARLVTQHGQKVEVLIAEKRTIAKSPSTRMPGNYFARAITQALREQGLV